MISKQLLFQDFLPSTVLLNYGKIPLSQTLSAHLHFFCFCSFSQVSELFSALPELNKNLETKMNTTLFCIFGLWMQKSGQMKIVNTNWGFIFSSSCSKEPFQVGSEAGAEGDGTRD